MPAPQRIIELVENFKANFAHVQSPKYKEEDLRSNYLNPFFQELGWDMEDRAGRGALRDLRYEETIKSGAPDYGFYTDGKLRFFVEAKNPSVNICTNQDAALQLRGYGWSARVSLSILTDFEELSIYDTTVKPRSSDQAHVARRGGACIHYTEFVERWDEIVAMFSREAVKAGSLEKLEKARSKQTVDKELLTDISHWREILAKNIANRNKLSEERLNRVVQDTISRILFLRICEDRGIAHEGDLSGVAEGDDIYANLYKLFKKAEKRYDSDLFEVASIADLVIDDKVLKEIISELYFPKSPYKFDAIPAEILGQVYEQFLGKVIRLTEGGRAKVDEKPEVRKAGGIYYTPTYIVEYIVRETVGKLVEGKTPTKIKTLSIVDPACGSGSFLLGAYKFLAEWYRDWYVADSALKHEKAKRIYRDADKQWQLTLDERKRILTAHIYGVDLDRQAAELAKLSLMLEALRAPEQQSLFNDQMLPCLGNNIKSGNSLIGNDFFGGQVLPDRAEMARVNPFDWQTEFTNIFRQGGFDVVIGNPPWGSFFSDKDKEYLIRLYVSKTGEPESHLFFIEKGLSIISRQGILAYVTPNTWLTVKNSIELRSFLLTHASLIEVTELTKYIFEDAPDMVPILFFCGKGKPKNCRVRRPLVTKVDSANFHKAFKDLEIDPSVWASSDNLIINLRATTDARKINAKCESKSKLLGNISGILYGIKTGDNKKYLSKDKSATHSAKALKTGELARYSMTWRGLYLWWNESLAGFRSSPVEVPKIVIQYIRKISMPRRIIAALDERGEFYPLNNYSYVIVKDGKYPLEYLLGLLNSNLLNYYFSNNFVDYNIKPAYLSKLPIKPADSNKSVAEQIIGLVKKMTALGEQNTQAKEESERSAIKRQFDATDRQIDQLVYKLYGLTDEEIRIVEEASK